jgi:N-dimethylarginine dimethylaminohydrolase
MLSRPRLDWTIRGRANRYSQQQQAAIATGAARADWQRLHDALIHLGADVRVLDSDDPLLTGLPYVAEAGHVVRGPRGQAVWLLPRLHAPHRRREPEVIVPFVQQLGFHTEAPPLGVVWEGQGDVIRIDDDHVVLTSGVGPYARTTEDAALWCAPWFAPAQTLHLRFRADPWFHGNTFLAAFRNSDRVVVMVCEEALLPGETERLRAFLPDVEWMVISKAQSLHYPTNALQVGNTILCGDDTDASIAALWLGLGLTMQPLSMPTLFGRGGGAAVCLSQRIDQEWPR